MFSPDEKYSCNPLVKTEASNNLNVEASINFMSGSTSGSTTTATSGCLSYDEILMEKNKNFA